LSRSWRPENEGDRYAQGSRGECAGYLWLFAKEFTVLILIAFVIAAPLAWIAMDWWLQGFVYKIPISPASFFLAILCTLVVAAITVSYDS